MILYKTLKGPGEAELIIERSRFIARAVPVSTKEEADAFIASIRERHKDATHNVPAMVVGDKMQIQWASDDGEPQGTSGAPMVQYLVNQGITNAVLVVTRYFGGIKLGTGGLVRAYTSAAREAVEAAGIVEARERFRVSATIDYAVLAQVERALAEEGIAIEDKTFTENVTLRLSGLKEQEESFKKLLAGLTKGAAGLSEREDFVG